MYDCVIDFLDRFAMKGWRVQKKLLLLLVGSYTDSVYTVSILYSFESYGQVAREFEIFFTFSQESVVLLKREVNFNLTKMRRSLKKIRINWSKGGFSIDISFWLKSNRAIGRLVRLFRSALGEKDRYISPIVSRKSRYLKSNFNTNWSIQSV